MKIFEWIEKQTGKLLVFTIILILIAPFILSLNSFWKWADLSVGDKVGSAIGGITAPIIGVLTSVFLYITLKKQIEFNKKQEALNEQQLQYQITQVLNENITSIRDSISNLDWYKYNGVSALRHYERNFMPPKDYEEKFIENFGDQFYDLLRRFEMELNFANSIENPEIKNLYLLRIYSLFYSIILWNCKEGYYQQMKDHTHLNDDSKYLLTSYLRLSTDSINFLAEKNYIPLSHYKKGVLQEFEEYIKKFKN